MNRFQIAERLDLLLKEIRYGEPEDQGTLRLTGARRQLVSWIGSARIEAEVE